MIWHTTDHRPAICEACGREATYLLQVHFPFRMMCQDCFQSILNRERAEVEQRAEEQK